VSSTPVAVSRRTALALRLGIGALLLVGAAWLFGAIAEDVATSDRLTLFDEVIARWLRLHATPTLTRWMLWVSNLHSTVAVSCYAAIAAVVLTRRRQWRRLAAVFICVAGGLTLNFLMKLAFHRARPVLDDPLLTLSSYSFPSGHVAASTLMYGLLVVWIFTRTRSPFVRVASLVVAFCAIALVAFSRMYLGVHYLSDVVAAFAEGVAWLALCLSALAVYWSRTPMKDAGAAPAA
jgi:undecaprenyl-diphosphatase